MEYQSVLQADRACALPVEQQQLLSHAFSVRASMMSGQPTYDGMVSELIGHYWHITQDDRISQDFSCMDTRQNALTVSKFVIARLSYDSRQAA